MISVTVEFHCYSVLSNEPATFSTIFIQYPVVESWILKFSIPQFNQYTKSENLTLKHVQCVYSYLHVIRLLTILVFNFFWLLSHSCCSALLTYAVCTYAQFLFFFLKILFPFYKMLKHYKIYIFIYMQFLKKHNSFDHTSRSGFSRQWLSEWPIIGHGVTQGFILL